MNGSVHPRSHFLTVFSLQLCYSNIVFACKTQCSVLESAIFGCCLEVVASAAKGVHLGMDL